jgi:hypothetical protein
MAPPTVGRPGEDVADEGALPGTGHQGFPGEPGHRVLRDRRIRVEEGEHAVPITAAQVRGADRRQPAWRPAPNGARRGGLAAARACSRRERPRRLALASSTHVIFVGQAGASREVKGLMPEEFRAVAQGFAALDKAVMLRTGQATERSETTVSKVPDVILSDHEWDLLAEAIKRERADRAEAAAQRLLGGGT